MDKWNKTIICILCSCGMWCKKRYDQGLSMRKKLPKWDLFFAYQDLRTQYFLCNIILINMDNLNNFNYKITEKNNYFGLMEKLYRQLPWNIGIFSTHGKSKKKLPNGNFFFACQDLRTQHYLHSITREK